jgi:signal transduction histidine kinase
VADVDRVIAIFNALLRLAEIDTGARRSGFVPVDVAEIAREVAEFYQPVAEMSGVRLRVDALAKANVAGDPWLLSQAMSNLIENALKYGANGGEVALTVLERDELIDIAVADRGPGIGEEERAKVTERFYRGDASRGTPGVGLGLSLVAAVARLHGGRLELADNDPGLRAALSIAAVRFARPFRATIQQPDRSQAAAVGWGLAH